MDIIDIYTVGYSASLAMLAACRFGSLSTLQPINRVSYVISTVLGWAVFNEAITAGQVTGILVITAGVVLLAKEEDS